MSSTLLNGDEENKAVKSECERQEGWVANRNLYIQ